MNKIITIISSVLILIGTHSCVEQILDADFEDLISTSIYDYMIENDSLYGDFLDILEAGGIDKTLSAYNIDGLGYTLFLPDNNAIQTYISESKAYSSLDQLLEDTVFAASFSRYHVVKMAIISNDFPFGALPEVTMSGDLLTVTFVIEEDTTYFKINNQAPVVKEDIELSNGYIHVINKVLNPITYSHYDWISDNPGFSIFTAAVEATDFVDILDRNIKDEEMNVSPVTLLLEHDSIYNKNNIFSLADLIEHLNPTDQNYTDPGNGLYGFVGYHVLDANAFLLDFEGQTTNYSTFSEVPVNINGIGLDLAINKYKYVFDTIISGTDTSYIDFIGFNYDASNVLTQSGAIHLIDQVHEQRQPSQAEVTFSFNEEPYFRELRTVPGDYIIEDSSLLNFITWTGPDLSFIKSADIDHPAWGQDYLSIDGDFTLAYTIPKIVQGIYTVILRADAFNANNALVEVFFDGKKIGGLIDLSNLGTANWPYNNIELGTIDISTYENHVIEVKSLIPGRFCWDMIRFEPYKD
jgi:uncharacterized surface protein with fasciclin (FAS1) repeats